MMSIQPPSEQNTNTDAQPHPARRIGPAMETADAAPIAQLNDAFRRSFIGGQVVKTAGVLTLLEAERIAVLLAVRCFDSFDGDNDPHGEHDFGAVEIGSQRCFWKIDAYNLDLRGHSLNPADPAVTARVLTIMLAEEY